MRIEVEDNSVTGYVDHSGNGEQKVITFYVEFGEVTVGSSIRLPSKLVEAKLVLTCMNQALIKAEEIA